MALILADSSAWVEYDRATGSSVDRLMTSLVADAGQLAVTEPVIMEVLSGARTDQRYDDLDRLLKSFRLLRVDHAIDYRAAAAVHRQCRRHGVTPRGVVDCLITMVAARHGASLVAADRDIDRVAAILSVDVVDPDDLS